MSIPQFTIKLLGGQFKHRYIDFLGHPIWAPKLNYTVVVHKKYNISRSSHRKCSVRKGVLRNLAKFTGKHLYQSLFKLQASAQRLWHRCFPANFAKFLRTPFLQNTFFTEHLQATASASHNNKKD